MMEQTAIDHDEYVLRRIHRSYFQPNGPIPVRAAFAPRPDENDGISVYREKLIADTPQAAAALVAEAGRKPANEYYVARLSVSALKNLGLTVLPAQQIGLPGHAVIFELNWQACRSNSHRCKLWQEDLARLASEAIVFRPQV